MEGNMIDMRYRLSTLLILLTLTVIATAWIGWPTRTAESFVDRHYRQDVSVTNPFREGTAEFQTFEEQSKPQLLQMELDHVSQLKIVPHNRSILEILAARQTFDFGTDEFTICRGAVVSGPTPFFDSGVRYYR